MPHKVVFRRVARRELDAAVDWYEGERAGLGVALQAAVAQALEAVAASPTAFPQVRGPIRRVVLRRFPYVIHYLLEPGRIVVLAVFHTRRDPRELEGRD